LWASSLWTVESVLFNTYYPWLCHCSVEGRTDVQVLALVPSQWTCPCKNTFHTPLEWSEKQHYMQTCFSLRKYFLCAMILIHLSRFQMFLRQLYGIVTLLCMWLLLRYEIIYFQKRFDKYCLGFNVIWTYLFSWIVITWVRKWFLHPHISLKSAAYFMLWK